LTSEPPAFELRVNALKLFLELELFDISSNIAEELINENDSDPEIWYLYSFSLAPNDPNDAKYALDKCISLFGDYDDIDEDILAQIKDLKARIEKDPKYVPNEIDLDDNDNDNIDDDDDGMDEN